MSFDDAINSRIPGESIIVVPSPDMAEAYLSGVNLEEGIVEREEFPNASGLYARVRYRNRIPEDKVFISADS